MKSVIENDEVCTTQRAAEILGVSVSSVQQLVESGAIDAWKTRGGHRRIPMAAVLAYKGQPGRERATILVVEDNPMQRILYQKHLGAWNLTAQLVFCENGYQALLEVARRQPDIVVTDIVMEGIDGYELLNTIVNDPQLRPMHIAVVSALGESDLVARGGLPPGVVFFGKPVNYDELRGYLRAGCANFLRAAR
ncbi:response regulator [Duganella phyllosphaerae]|uniref:Sporulation initiation phosphotransferase F n=1 Tax=Duganella phyllosphaerae TaxID=762836 RepID=A0A1E7WCT8_9BURK|nr:response regulator [Duganella phyllosphaerae]OEZ95344.1 sporulation initiation phosphotransferase F [Duganella phyllosphaerae]